jgi:hypothetical protein
MTYVHLVADRASASGLPAFARDLLIRLGAKTIQERDSSHYPSGGYFLSELGKHRFRISVLDEVDIDAYRFLVVVEANDEGQATLEDYVTGTVRDLLLPAGYRIARVVNFGKRSMQIVPFEKANA